MAFKKIIENVQGKMMDLDFRYYYRSNNLYDNDPVHEANQILYDLKKASILEKFYQDCSEQLSQDKLALNQSLLKNQRGKSFKSIVSKIFHYKSFAFPKPKLTERVLKYFNK